MGRSRSLSQNTTLNINSQSSVTMNGNLAGAPGSQLEIVGQGPTLPHDGGSQLIFSGAFSQVTGLTLDATALILAPTGDPVAAVASLAPSGISTIYSGVSTSPYLGLDGTFANVGGVSNFLGTFGAGIGPNFAGTLGFDSFVNVESPGSPNTFDDPIDVSAFSGAYFLGLGTESTAILGIDAVITPYNNRYQFGGGGGTLTVESPLTDNGAVPRNLMMTTAPTPLTLLVQGTADYTGGTVSNGGVLIFENEVPLSGSIQNFAGYVGYTESAANITSAQQFVGLFDVNSANGVIGFDAADSNAGRTVSDAIDLSAFTGNSSPFLGTATNVTLSGSISPANGTYQFAAVKGGRLTVASNLTATTAGAVIGLVDPIENLGSNSVVTMTGTNTYMGGTVFNSGTLFINNGAALGTGPLTVPNGLPNGGTSQFTPYLAPYGSANVTLANPIVVAPFQGGPGIQLGNFFGGTMLTLTGPITDYPSTSTAIGINGPVTLTSSGNTYSGGTVFVGGSYSSLTLTPGATVGAITGTSMGVISTQVSGSIIPSGGNVAIPNGILVNYPTTLTLGADGNGNLLTIGTAGGSDGAISGNGFLAIDSNVTLNGANTFDGSTTVTNALVTMTNATGLGTGSVNLINSALTYGSADPVVTNLSGDATSAINLVTGATLTLDTEGTGSFSISGQHQRRRHQSGREDGTRRGGAQGGFIVWREHHDCRRHPYRVEQPGNRHGRGDRAVVRSARRR